MIKQVEVHGHRVNYTAWTEGGLGRAGPQSVVAYRKAEHLRRHLQKTFERLGDIPDFDPNADSELGIHSSPRGI